MPSSYTCLNYHLVFSTKNREPLITADIRERLYSYLGGILRNAGGVLLCAGGVPDHIHLACSMSKQGAISDMLRDLKSNSSGWVHDTFEKKGFAWQIGYGAFTVSYSGMEDLTRYIRNQEAHHRKMTFKEEFIELLKRHGIEYDERYIWD